MFSNEIDKICLNACLFIIMQPICLLFFGINRHVNVNALKANINNTKTHIKSNMSFLVSFLCVRGTTRIVNIKLMELNSKFKL